MSDYTVHMLREDHNELIPMIKILKNIQIPEDEWPQIIVDSITYKLNPNFPEADTLGFFKAKYGSEKGADYSHRFLGIKRFINSNFQSLHQKGLVYLDKKQNALMIDDKVFRALLESFKPPVPPSLFPTSTLQDQQGVFILERVLEAIKL